MRRYVYARSISVPARRCVVVAAFAFLLSVCASSCVSMGIPVPGEAAKRETSITAEYFQIAKGYEDLKNYTKAIEYYKLAMKNKELYDSAYYKLGRCYALAKKWEEALVIYKVLLKKDPENTSLLRSIAYIEAMRGNTSEAEILYAGLVEKNPTDSALLRNYLSVLIVNEQFENAVAQYTLLSETFPDDKAIADFKAKLAEYLPPEPSEESGSESDGLGAEPSYIKDSPDEAEWDIPMLDTARDVLFLYEVEKDVILELNKARFNPKKYAELYIAPRARRFKRKLYEGAVETVEGARAVRECVKYMSGLGSLSLLEPAEGLSNLARARAYEQSRTNQAAHTGYYESTLSERMGRYGSFASSGESVSYGRTSAREIVVQLLIDDGIKERANRKKILNPAFTFVGTGYTDRHEKFGSECVIDLADDWHPAESEAGHAEDGP